jgi:UPF0716 family protein affecting phage T7 exclusion
MRSLLRWGRRILVALVGGVVTLAGLAMMVLPGPGLITLILGLAILGLEFEIARVWLKRARQQLAKMTTRLKSFRARR